MIAEIRELEKKLNKKKEELNRIKSELDRLIQSDEQLKVKEDAQSKIINSLDNELKLAQEDMNVTIYRNECRLLYIELHICHDSTRYFQSNHD